MITSTDLQVKRTPDELNKFVSTTFESIRADDKVIQSDPGQPSFEKLK